MGISLCVMFVFLLDGLQLFQFFVDVLEELSKTAQLLAEHSQIPNRSEATILCIVSRALPEHETLHSGSCKPCRVSRLQSWQLVALHCGKSHCEVLCTVPV